MQLNPVATLKVPPPGCNSQFTRPKGFNIANWNRNYKMHNVFENVQCGTCNVFQNVCNALHAKWSM